MHEILTSDAVYIRGALVQVCFERGTDDNLEALELAIRIQLESLREGAFLATSDELPGLVAQGRTVAETLEIARDVARKLIEARREREGAPDLPSIADQGDYTIVVAA